MYLNNFNHTYYRSGIMKAKNYDGPMLSDVRKLRDLGPIFGKFGKDSLTLWQRNAEAIDRKQKAVGEWGRTKGLPCLRKFASDWYDLQKNLEKRLKKKPHGRD